MTDYPFVGSWHMIHDNWVGTLVLTVADHTVTRNVPPCTFTFRRAQGTYTPSAGGPPLAVTGRVGGRDNNVRGQQCGQSDHGITFTIAFPGGPPQPFKGYIFTQAGPTYLAGFTWWQGLPFGWYGAKI
jgi:hypothetical protein